MIKLPKNFKLIFKSIAGSHLYGTNTPESDEDIRGIFIPSKEYFYGFLNNTKHYRSNIEDIEYHEIRQFLKLILDNNPSSLELLFIPENKWIISSKEWEEIISNRKYFISKKCKFTFSGYAFSQLHRIKRHRSWLLNPPTKKPERKDYGLLETKSTLSKDQIGAFNELVAIYLGEIRESHSLRTQLLEMEETINYKTIMQQIKGLDTNTLKSIIPISDNFLEALQKEKAYMQAKKYWDSYQSWKKNRNKKRAYLEEKFGYDSKHASHLLRLMYEGEELLSTGNLTFPRPEVDFLKSVLNGALTYEQLLELVRGLDEKFEKLYNESSLPHSPNKVKIDNLCIKLIETFLKN